MTNITLQKFLNNGYDLIQTETKTIQGAPEPLSAVSNTSLVIINSISNDLTNEGLYIGDQSVQTTNGFPLFKLSWDETASRILYTPIIFRLETTTPENFYLIAGSQIDARIMYLKLKQ